MQIFDPLSFKTRFKTNFRESAFSRNRDFSNIDQSTDSVGFEINNEFVDRSTFVTYRKQLLGIH